MPTLRSPLPRVTPIAPHDDAMAWAQWLVGAGHLAHMHEVAHGPQGAPAVIVAGWYVATDASDLFIARMVEQYERNVVLQALGNPNRRNA